MNNEPAGPPWLRASAGSIIQRVSDALITVFPGIHPDHVTTISAFLACGAEVLSGIARENNWKASAKWGILGMKTAALLGDAVDGGIARATGRSRVWNGTPVGPAIDAGADRIVELFASAVGMQRAFDRGDNLTSLAFFLRGLSCIPPSILRAAIEAEGVQCKRCSPFAELAGSAVGRRFESILGDFLEIFLADPAMRNFRLAGNGIVTAGNMIVATSRAAQWLRARRLPIESKNKVLDWEAVVSAKLKRAVLGCVGGLCAGALTVLFARSFGRQRKETLSP